MPKAKRKKLGAVHSRATANAAAASASVLKLQQSLASAEDELITILGGGGAIEATQWHAGPKSRC